MTTYDPSPVPDFTRLWRLDGKAFVVAGAGAGIGRQSAHALAQAGARVLCVDIIAERAQEVAAEIGGVPITADVRDRAMVQGIVDECQKQFGQIDGVVDIIGMARFAPILEAPDEDWEWTFGMVLKHAQYFVEIAGRAMREHGGTMAFVASIDGTISAPGHAAYGAAKAGLLNLVRTASVELGPLGIRVNAVCPGGTNTPRVLAHGRIPPSKAEGGTLYIPLGSANDPWDIAAGLLFLSAPISRHITGQALTVDGGSCNTVYDVENRDERRGSVGNQAGPA